MILYDVLNPKIITAIEMLAGIRASYKDKPRNFTEPNSQSRVLLKWLSAIPIGRADRIYTDNNVALPNPNLIATYIKPHHLTLEIIIESEKHNDDKFASHRMQRISSGIRYDSIRKILKPMALVSVGDINDIPEQIRDDHITSTAVLEIIFAVDAVSFDPISEYCLETVGDIEFVE